MGPNLPGLDVTTTLEESLPPSETLPIDGGGNIIRWMERLDGAAPVSASLTDGTPLVAGDATLRYLAGWPDDAGWDALLAPLCVGLETHELSPGVRIRDTGTHRIVLNYGPEEARFDGHSLPPAGVLRLPL